MAFRTSRSKRFSTSGKHINDVDNKVPGPGQYNNPNSLSRVGKYLVSSHKGGTQAKFGSSKRITAFD